MKLLHVDSSILKDASVSRQLTAALVSEWTETHSDTHVEYLDLAVDAPNHFSADALGTRGAVQEHPTEAQCKKEPRQSERQTDGQPKK